MKSLVTITMHWREALYRG